jgi:hypothetical protein
MLHGPGPREPNRIQVCGAGYGAQWQAPLGSYCSYAPTRFARPDAWRDAQAAHRRPAPACHGAHSGEGPVLAILAMLARRALRVAPGGSAPPFPSAARRGPGFGRSGRKSRFPVEPKSMNRPKKALDRKSPIQVPADNHVLEQKVRRSVETGEVLARVRDLFPNLKR